MIEEPSFDGKEQVKTFVQNAIIKSVAALLDRSQLLYCGKQWLKQLGKRMLNSPSTLLIFVDHVAEGAGLERDSIALNIIVISGSATTS